jgi:hypothetical protein
LSRPTATGLLRQSGDRWVGYEAFGERTNGLEPAGGISALARIPGGILAGGAFSKVGAPGGWIATDQLARWDGSRWWPLPPLPLYGSVNAIAVHGSTIDVGGTFYDFSQSPWRITPVLRLVGSTWTPLDTLSLSVGAMRIYQGALVIGGQRPSSDGLDVGGAYRWDGAHWVSLGELADHGSFKGVHAMTELDGRLVVGGAFDAIDGVAASNIAAWDGTSWSALGAGFGREDNLNSVYALEVYKGRLIAAGEFGNPGPGIESWDGAAWSPLGNNRGFGSALAVAGDELIAGFDDYEVQVIAWNGETWRELGTSDQGMVNALLPDDGHVYVGGPFAQFGGQASVGFARWDSLDPAPATTSFSSGRPNPFRDTIAFDFRVRVLGPLHLLVQDVTGRRVASIEASASFAGAGQAQWDGRDASGRKSPPASTS